MPRKRRRHFRLSHTPTSPHRRAQPNRSIRVMEFNSGTNPYMSIATHQVRWHCCRHSPPAAAGPLRHSRPAVHSAGAPCTRSSASLLFPAIKFVSDSWTVHKTLNAGWTRCERRKMQRKCTVRNILSYILVFIRTQKNINKKLSALNAVTS